MSKIKPKQQKIFLMDMENVGCNGLIGAEQLSKNDEIHVFIGKCTDRIKINFFASLQKKGINLVFHDIVCTGKNALDFQIVSLLSILVANRENAKFYVVSKDKGFDNSISFLEHYYKSKERDLSITRLSSINDIFIKKAKFLLLVEEKLRNDDMLERLKKEEALIVQGMEISMMSYISSFISYPAWVSEKQEQTITEIVYGGCYEGQISKMRKYIREKCISAFGEKKGNEIYGMNKNILMSLLENVKIFIKQPKKTAP